MYDIVIDKDEFLLFFQFGIVAELLSVVDYDVLEKARKFGGPPSESDLSHRWKAENCFTSKNATGLWQDDIWFWGREGS